jgi:hypothetical protein
MFRYEHCFILTGIHLDDVPAPTVVGSDGVERPDRQAQLLAAARGYIDKLNPDLATNKILYVRVLKSPAPYVLEVECETKEG